MERERKPNVFIVAGPDGAGKSTFARLFLPEYADCKELVNADLIAAGLSPFNPESLAIQTSRSWPYMPTEPAFPRSKKPARLENSFYILVKALRRAVEAPRSRENPEQATKGPNEPQKAQASREKPR